MPRQITFASIAHGSKKKVTRCETFLAEMEIGVPCRRLLALIAPSLSKNKEGKRAPEMGSTKKGNGWYS